MIQTWKKAPPPRVLIGAAAILAYQLVFVSRGLFSRFAPDDAMNIYYYWSMGSWRLIRGLVLYFSTCQRPMGGLFYSVLYHFFGLNPFPYHAVITGLLLVNTFLAYRFAVLVSKSELIGGLCAFVVAYHPQMAQAVFLSSFVFDVLCLTFYFLALNYYISIRASGKPLGTKQVVVFLLLYIAALDSKEMAVTLPVVILLYELVWRRAKAWPPRHLIAWACNEGLPALIGGVLTGVYILGKTLGPDAVLMHLAPYAPLFTRARYMESTTRFFNTVFFCQSVEQGFFTPARVLTVWALLLLVACWKRDGRLIWLWLFTVVTPLPVTFVPGRGGICVSIPMVGWAVLIAILFVWLCDTVARARPLAHIPPLATRAVLILLALGLLGRQVVRLNRTCALPLRFAGDLTWSVIRQVRALQPRVPHGSKILFVNDVFDGWDTKFIAELIYRDRSVNVWLQPKTPLTPAEVAGMNYVFAFEGKTLKRLRP